MVLSINVAVMGGADDLVVVWTYSGTKACPGSAIPTWTFSRVPGHLHDTVFHYKVSFSPPNSVQF